MTAFAGLDVGTTSEQAGLQRRWHRARIGRRRHDVDTGPHGTQTDAESLCRGAFER